MIVTNNHVVEGAGGDIEVAFTDGTSQSAKVLGTFARQRPRGAQGRRRRTCRSPSSAAPTTLQVGDEVIAIGNALALEGGLSVTRGIISAKDRTVPEENGARALQRPADRRRHQPGQLGWTARELRRRGRRASTPRSPTRGEAQNVGFAISIDAREADHRGPASRPRGQDRVPRGRAPRRSPRRCAKELEPRRPTAARWSGGDRGLGGGRRRPRRRDDVIIAVGGTDGRLARRARRPRSAGSSPATRSTVLIERDGDQQTVSVDARDPPDSNG